MSASEKRQVLGRVRRIVVKLGSSVVATAHGVDRDRVSGLTAEVAGLHRDGREVIIVTSGARAAGLARLGLKAIPSTIPEQQAAAAIGQIRLMSFYEECFAEFNRHIGQVLLTAADIEDRVRYLNARHTIEHLLSHGIIPVVNENDSVAVDELKFGDNDRLSALVAGLVGADLLVILTDVDGLYSAAPGSPGAALIPLVDDIDAVASAAGGVSSAIGTGGMASKLASARSASHRGIPTVIANGKTPGTLSRVLQPDFSVGTLVLASDTPISNRKHWIAYGMPVHGAIVLDDGAVRAVSERGSSLLPSGVTEIRGTFRPGECVGLVTNDGRIFARGLVAYDSEACGRIRGIASKSIAATLGYHMGDEVIHRDDLVLLADVGGKLENEQ